MSKSVSTCSNNLMFEDMFSSLALVLTFFGTSKREIGGNLYSPLVGTSTGSLFSSKLA